MSSTSEQSNVLVQRRQTQNSEDHSEERDAGQINDDEDIDHDSKETRLTLMEEVLLLGLKDREVI